MADGSARWLAVEVFRDIDEQITTLTARLIDGSARDRYDQLTGEIRGLLKAAELIRVTLTPTLEKHDPLRGRDGNRKT